MSQGNPPTMMTLADPYFTWNPPTHGVRTVYLNTPSSDRVRIVCGPCADTCADKRIWKPSRYDL